MENITYRDQIIWGTSLKMAKDDEISLCYNYIYDLVKENTNYYKICEDSKSTKNFIDIRWQCGEAVHSLDLCDKEPSIKKEELSALIESMVSAEDISIDGETIINTFKKREFIDIYNCGRVFFIKKN